MKNRSVHELCGAEEPVHELFLKGPLHADIKHLTGLVQQKSMPGLSPPPLLYMQQRAAHIPELGGGTEETLHSSLWSLTLI